jgi:predicted RNase H-related nuclease YkuK (DUF458 family)
MRSWPDLPYFYEINFIEERGYTMSFRNPSDGPIGFEALMDDVYDFIKTDPESKYQLIVGTDSSEYEGQATFVNVIVVHRKGSGGRFYWRRRYEEPFPSIRERIYEESNQSINLAERVDNAILERLVELDVEVSFEVHVDISEDEDNRTSEFVDEITGMIKGYGFDPKTKDEAYGASHTADRYT